MNPSKSHGLLPVPAWFCDIRQFERKRLKTYLSTNGYVQVNLLLLNILTPKLFAQSAGLKIHPCWAISVSWLVLDLSSKLSKILLHRGHQNITLELTNFIDTHAYAYTFYTHEMLIYQKMHRSVLNDPAGRHHLLPSQSSGLELP